jgi:cyanuric acid amidohydrolase
MRHALDLGAVMQALESVGLSALDRRSQDGSSIFSPRRKPRLTASSAAFATRCSTIPTSTPPGTRAALGGLIGGVAGTGAVYVSGGAEHQGPAGGGAVAVIARV